MKKIILGLSALSLGFLLASCNNAKTTTTTNTTNTTTSSIVKDDYKLNVVCPSGAPILSIASAVKEYEANIDKENIGVAADTLPGFFTSGNADIIIAPINAGVKLFNASKSSFKLAAVITWGNTYFASQTEFSLSDIKTKGVTLFGKDTINSAVAEYVLEQNEFAPEEYSYKDTAATTKNDLIDDSNVIVMTAEPMLSAAKTNLAKQSKSVTSYSVADMYKELTTYDLPQAAIFINPSLETNHKSLLDGFLNEVDEADELIDTTPEVVAQAGIDLGLDLPLQVLTNAVKNCKINYQKASQKKAEINKIIEIAPSYFGSTPDDSIYY